MNALLAILAGVVALPLLLLVGVVLGPVALVVLFVLVCAVPAVLVGAVVQRDRR